MTLLEVLLAILLVSIAVPAGLTAILAYLKAADRMNRATETVFKEDLRLFQREREGSRYADMIDVGGAEK